LFHLFFFGAKTSLISSSLSDHSASLLPED
jgi:hypothetical protein